MLGKLISVLSLVATLIRSLAIFLFSPQSACRLTSKTIRGINLLNFVAHIVLRGQGESCRFTSLSPDVVHLAVYRILLSAHALAVAPECYSPSAITSSSITVPQN